MHYKISLSSGDKLIINFNDKHITINYIENTKETVIKATTINKIHYDLLKILETFYNRDIYPNSEELDTFYKIIAFEKYGEYLL